MRCTAPTLPHAPTNPTRCAFASPAAPKTCARPCGSATRSKRYTPMARPPAAAFSNRHAMWSRWRRSCCRANSQGHRSSSWEVDAMKLREIAHSRTGDKGNTSNISVIAYDEKHYPLLLAQVTSARVKAHFAGVVEGEVVRYELPNIAALNFCDDPDARRRRNTVAGARRPRQIPKLRAARSGDRR